MNFQEIGINARNWVDPTQNRDYWRVLVNAALNLHVPQAMELVRDRIGIIGAFCFSPSPEFPKFSFERFSSYTKSHSVNYLEFTLFPLQVIQVKLIV